LYPKISAGNTRHIAASTTFVVQTRQYLRYSALLMMGIVTMLHELGMNNFVSIVFANAEKWQGF
jgi:hypothetical protein